MLCGFPVITILNIEVRELCGSQAALTLPYLLHVRFVLLRGMFTSPISLVQSKSFINFLALKLNHKAILYVHLIYSNLIQKDLKVLKRQGEVAKVSPWHAGTFEFRLTL